MDRIFKTFALALITLWPGYALASDIIAADVLRMRTTPSADADIVGRVRINTSVEDLTANDANFNQYTFTTAP